MEAEHTLWLHEQRKKDEADGTYKAVVNVFAIDRTSPPSSIKIPGHREKASQEKQNTGDVSQTRGRDTRELADDP